MVGEFSHLGCSGQGAEAGVSSFACRNRDIANLSQLINSKPRLPDEYHIVLTLRLPPKHKVDETNSWLSLACNIIDVLYLKPKLLPEVQIAKLVSVVKLLLGSQLMLDCPFAEETTD